MKLNDFGVQVKHILKLNFHFYTILKKNNVFLFKKSKSNFELF